MAYVDLREDLPHNSHKDHRTLDVTAIGESQRRLLCLDCKIEYHEPAPAPDRAWMERPL
jgi:hypothetical protein